MSHALRATIKLAFFAGSLIYLASFFRQSINATDLPAITVPVALSVLAAAVVFSLTAIPSSLAWRKILTALSHPTPWLASSKVFFVTQVGKYLPGNIGHHVGRIALARSSLGIPGPTGTISIIHEGATTCLAAISLSLACFSFRDESLPLDTSHLNGLNPERILLASLVAGFVSLSFVSIVRSVRERPTSAFGSWVYQLVPTWATILRTLPYYLAGHIASGAAIWIIASSMADMHMADFLAITGAYAFAWVAGFLVPGAPGGLGVREAVFTAVLRGSHTPELVIFIALASRVSSVIADLLIFLAGTLIPRGEQPANG